jgi:uncharacterized membrane protein YidH (DUF202 family)
VWFRILSLAIGTALLVKTVAALAIPNRFYATRRRQYASEFLPPKLLVAPVIIAVLAVVAWYATIFHYRPWGWIVTGFLTALAGIAADHVFRWESHRRTMLKAVTNPNVWKFDCLLLAVGAAFVTLAVLVY